MTRALLLALARSTRAETRAVIGARPARLPYVLTPLPVPIVVAGLSVRLLIPLGWN